MCMNLNPFVYLSMAKVVKMQQLGKKNIFLTEMRNGELHIIGRATMDKGEFDGRKTTNVQMVSKTLREFCSETSMHGVRYFMERNRHFLERIWWLIAFTLSAAFCVYSTLQIWTKWQQYPVIMSFEGKTTPISSIPFPAVTVCTTKKLDGSQMEFRNFTNYSDESLDELSDDETYKMDVYYQLCRKSQPYFANHGTKARFRNKSKSIYQMFQIMNHRTIRYYIDSHFHGPTGQIITGEGLCFTFNSLNSREIYTDDVAKSLFTVRNMPKATNWNIEDGYEVKSAKNQTYPFRVYDTGSFETLRLVVYTDFNNSVRCIDKAQGYRIALHSPNELPRLPENFIFLPTQQEMYITLKPNVIVTSNELRKYSPSKRGCYFRNERKLRFFQVYSQRHCEIECLANYTRESCGCVKFSMPGNRSTQICTMFEYQCVQEANLYFSTQLRVQCCNCLPDCSSISYDVESSQVQILASNEERKWISLSSDLRVEIPSVVTISFKQPHFIALIRKETYTTSDFFASCGGLFGLFMGVSVLSIVELIYFFSLRLFCTLRKRNAVGANVTTWMKGKQPNVNTKQFKKRRY